MPEHLHQTAVFRLKAAENSALQILDWVGLLEQQEPVQEIPDSGIALRQGFRIGQWLTYVRAVIAA